MDKFIVIGGMPRSGTNLVRRIVGSHSTIAIPPAEFQLFHKLNQGASVEKILSNKRLADWGIDFTQFYKSEACSAYIKILQMYTDAKGKMIPGEKSPMNEFYLDKIESCLSSFELKFIHMIRNPFDVAASLQHIPSAKGALIGKKDLAKTTALNWQRSAKIGLAKSFAQPEKHLIVKYEDLIASPIDKTKTICKFIGVNFEEERMLSFQDYSGSNDNTSFSKELDHSNSQQNIYKPVSRKHHLNKSYIQEISRICGEVAWALGYDDKDFHLSPPFTLNNAGPLLKLRKRIRSILTA